MVQIELDESDDPVPCEGCGTLIPPFLPACPYCDGDDATAYCPRCGEEIHVESQQCSACKAWITPTTKPPAVRPAGGRRRLWIVVALLLALILLFLGTRL